MPEPTIVHGPLADGLPLCHSCFTGHHACSGGECTCDVLVCILDQLRERFALIPSHVWVASRLLAPPAE